MKKNLQLSFVFFCMLLFVIVVSSVSAEEVVKIIPVGSYPQDLVSSPDGQFVYSVNYYDNSVTVIDTTSLTVTSTIPVGAFPYFCCISSDGKYLYVSNSGQDTISIIDTEINLVVMTFGSHGSRPCQLALTPDDSKLYVGNHYSNYVSVFETTNHSCLKNIVGIPGSPLRPYTLTVSPDGAFVYVANFKYGTVSKLDTSIDENVDVLYMGGKPQGCIVTPDSKYLLIGNRASDKITVIDTDSFSIYTTVQVGLYPKAMAVDQDGNYAYIANHLSSSVSIVDLETFQEIQIIENLPYPYGISLDSLSGRLYVLAQGDESVYVIQLVVPINIDIKPGSYPNSINPRSKGVIHVAILTTDTFDATNVDGSTVRFGPDEAEPVHYALEDVDLDGELDMSLHFRTQKTGIECGDTEATLTGETIEGQKIKGTDSIRTVGCKK